MTVEKDLCPSTDNGNHRYFIFKVVEVFEPVDSAAVTHEYGQLYAKIEYAISGCNCGSSIKQKVKQQ
jgi:hypothetical protein